MIVECGLLNLGLGGPNLSLLGPIVGWIRPSTLRNLRTGTSEMWLGIGIGYPTLYYRISKSFS